MDPTFDYGTVAGKLLENTPMTALMGFALWKVVAYLKELITAHAAEIKSIQEKHDTERAASQALLLDLTKQHITSSNALVGVVEKMEQRLCDHGEKIEYILATVSPDAGRTKKVPKNRQLPAPAVTA